MTVRDADQLEANCRYLVERNVPLPPSLRDQYLVRVFGLETCKTVSVNMQTITTRYTLSPPLVEKH